MATYKNDSGLSLAFVKGFTTDKDGNRVLDMLDVRRGETTDLAGVDMEHPHNKSRIRLMTQVSEGRSSRAAAKPKE